MSFGTEVGLGPGHIVLDGTQLPPPKKGHTPFVFYVYCGQTAAWIKMPLGTKVGVSPGDIVLDGNPAPPTKNEGTAPNFRPMSVVAKRLVGSRCHLLQR